MEHVSTIQKMNNLNIVFRDGEKGPGGAFHIYKVLDISSENEVGTIAFQKGPRKEPDSISGVLDTDLLEIVRDRLACFQSGEFSTRENAIALTHVEEALLWMSKRANDRAERNVLGTYNK